MSIEKEWELYEIIDKNPGLTVADLSKLIKLPEKKIIRYLKRLKKNHMIQAKYFPMPMKSFLKKEG